MALLRAELTKQRRRRTAVALGLTVVVPVIIAVAVKTNPPALAPSSGPAQNFTAFTARTGLFLPVVALQLMSQFLLVVIVALFAGDAVAAEANWGTLRSLLTRPVSRTRLLVAKAGSAGLLAVLATATAIVSALVVGVAAFGWHPLSVAALGHAGHQSELTVLAHVGVAGAYVLGTVAAVAAFAFMVSTMTDSPAAAVFAGLGLYVVSQILNNLASLDPVSFVLPTHDQSAWTVLFEGRGPTTAMLDGLLVQIPYVLAFAAVAWWSFRRKDVLS